jgi:IS5 family transposase
LACCSGNGSNERRSLDRCCAATAECAQRGGAKTPEREAFEKSREFKKGQRFRCRAEGLERFELFVGVAVLTNNLMKIADLLIKRSSRNRRAA